LGEEGEDGEEVAIKFESINHENPRLKHEAKVYETLAGSLNVQEINPDKMSMREILIGAGQNIGAGSGTTSASLSAIFYSLCQNPDIMRKLRPGSAEAKEEGGLVTWSSIKRWLSCRICKLLLKIT
jgi:hypothetical protein